MPEFLIDENLPQRLDLWKDEKYIFQKDIGEGWSDSKVWDFAKAQNLTIITRDSDFSNRILVSSPPPKVIHIRLGNVKFNEFGRKLNELWPAVTQLIKDNKLVSVYPDRFEVIK